MEPKHRVSGPRPNAGTTLSGDPGWGFWGGESGVSQVRRSWGGESGVSQVRGPWGGESGVSQVRGPWGGESGVSG